MMSFICSCRNKVGAELHTYLAGAGAPAVLAPAPASVMLTDAGAPAVLALAPDAVMLADAGAPAAAAPAPLAVVLALLVPLLWCARCNLPLLQDAKVPAVPAAVVRFNSTDT
jgi:hypothetical protein